MVGDGVGSVAVQLASNLIHVDSDGVGPNMECFGNPNELPPHFRQRVWAAIVGLSMYS